MLERRAGMIKMISRFARFRSEPYSMKCPKCGSTMTWNPYQGPMGGWKCPNCDFVVDHKG